MPEEISLLDYIKGRLAAHLPEKIRPRGWQPINDEEASLIWAEVRAGEETATQTQPEAKIAEAETAPSKPPKPSAEGEIAEAFRPTAPSFQKQLVTAPPKAPSAPTAQPAETKEKPQPSKPLPWALLGAVILMLIAQRTIEPPGRNWGLALAIYALALALLGIAARSHNWELPAFPKWKWEGREDGPIHVRTAFLIIGIAASAIAFLAFGGNRFTTFNITMWGIGILSTAAAFWNPAQLPKLWKAVKRGEWEWRITWWHVALVGLGALALFFRYWHLRSVPAEMFSDHAEKLLDVADVLAGKHRIFFPRNTGREAIQMYLTACVIRCLGVPFSFLALKLGTATMGVLALPFIYLLGKEIGGKWVGFWATLLTAIAYWPNVISRVALRFTLYPAFAAPTLYFLVRALHRGRRNDYIWAGIFLGMGVHGYSPFRLMPLTVLLALLLYWLHEKKGQKRERAVVGIAIVALFSFIVFLPLFRYMLSNWQMFFYRGATRLGQVERPYPGNPFMIFLSNLFKAWIMPFWDNGVIWVHSIPHRPALDWVSAALYALGTVTALVHYARKRRWEDLFLLLSVPFLMLPSILSLAFPNENPCLNRTGAAYIPIFIITALGIVSLQRSLTTSGGKWAGKVVFWALIAGLMLISIRANYNLVFKQYNQEFRAGAWNTSEMGHVIRGFYESVGAPDRAWVIPYPYWVDTRLVAINAGVFPKITDYALPREHLNETKTIPAPKLFLLKPEDKDSLNALQHTYPDGIVKKFVSHVPGRDFIIYCVP